MGHSGWTPQVISCAINTIDQCRKRPPSCVAAIQIAAPGTAIAVNPDVAGRQYITYKAVQCPRTIQFLVRPGKCKGANGGDRHTKLTAVYCRQVFCCTLGLNINCVQLTTRHWKVVGLSQRARPVWRAADQTRTDVYKALQVIQLSGCRKRIVNTRYSSLIHPQGVR
ncbi:hypothetical protein GALL_513730 [mine drainage metagenome]|uniref:Uncharacterized protein n=1 Tax=mine drainage metagenome TaxID=410659 RepID=A0A1J5P758_9ZZZZ